MFLNFNLLSFFTWSQGHNDLCVWLMWWGSHHLSVNIVSLTGNVTFTPEFHLLQWQCYFDLGIRTHFMLKNKWVKSSKCRPFITTSWRYYWLWWRTSSSQEKSCCLLLPVILFICLSPPCSVCWMRCQRCAGTVLRGSVGGALCPSPYPGVCSPTAHCVLSRHAPSGLANDLKDLKVTKCDKMHMFCYQGQII